LRLHEKPSRDVVLSDISGVGINRRDKRKKK